MLKRINNTDFPRLGVGVQRATGWNTLRFWADPLNVAKNPFFNTVFGRGSCSPSAFFRFIFIMLGSEIPANLKFSDFLFSFYSF